MKYQRRAALASLTIHGAIAAAIAGIAAFSVPAARARTIDFSIEKSPVIPQPALPQPPKKQALRESRKPAPQLISDEEVFPDSTTQDTSADTAQFTDAEYSDANTQPALVASVGAVAIPPDTGLTRERQRQRYLKEQFEYIRDIVYRKAAYPPMAMEMNLTGTVLLSFCVREDGGVENVGILKGSGASILDRDAVATVKRAAPFPRPPARVIVTFPMEYRLE